jgi:hypothetical protein
MRVVLRDARLHLADQVGADVRGLGEDAAAQPRKDGDERRAEGERGQRLGDDVPILLDRDRAPTRPGQVPVEPGDGEEAEARHQHARDRARAERGGEPALERAARRLRRANIGAHRDVHADIARHARQHGAEQEAHGRYAAQGGEHDHGDDHADDGDGGILPAQIGLGALLDGRRDVLHLGVARRLTQHLAGGEGAIQHRDQAAENGDGNGCHSDPSLS